MYSSCLSHEGGGKEFFQNSGEATENLGFMLHFGGESQQTTSFFSKTMKAQLQTVSLQSLRAEIFCESLKFSGDDISDLCLFWWSA